MTLADELTPAEQTLVRFEVAKRNLVEQMVLYGINEDQARIQVESLVTLTLAAGRVLERVNSDAVRGAQEGLEVGRRQTEEGG